MLLIEKTSTNDRGFITSFTREHWGADFVVTRGRKVFPAEIVGFVARENGKACVGLVVFEVIGSSCEIVAFETLRKHEGIGTQLLESVRKEARRLQCTRLWLITTNDNLEALRFYQRRGFRICAVHPGAIDESRKIKPTIPTVGNFGIPIRDEIELEIEI